MFGQSWSGVMSSLPRGSQRIDFFYRFASLSHRLSRDTSAPAYFIRNMWTFLWLQTNLSGCKKVQRIILHRSNVSRAAGDNDDDRPNASASKLWLPWLLLDDLHHRQRRFHGYFPCFLYLKYCFQNSYKIFYKT